MTAHQNEEELLRSVALQNAQTILVARQRAEEELARAERIAGAQDAGASSFSCHDRARRWNPLPTASW